MALIGSDTLMTDWRAPEMAVKVSQGDEGEAGQPPSHALDRNVITRNFLSNENERNNCLKRK
jgi:hypothetical protein